MAVRARLSVSSFTTKWQLLTSQLLLERADCSSKGSWEMDQSAQYTDVNVSYTVRV